MFFYLSKFAWMVAAPSSLLFLALCGAAILMWTRWRRLGAWLATAAAIAAAIIALTPLPQQALAALEDRFPFPALPERIDGIIVLAGMVQLEASEAHGTPVLNSAIERVLVAADLAHRYPEARVVFTGGSGNVYRPELSEARVIRPLFDLLGIGDRVTYEESSRNTFQNALLTAELVEPQPDEVWVLVTSAFHMPRSVGCFRAVGWDVVPYPADFRTDTRARWWPPQVAFARGLQTLDFVVHEWIGMLAYWWTGRSSTLFPGPNG